MDGGLPGSEFSKTRGVDDLGMLALLVVALVPRTPVDAAAAQITVDRCVGLGLNGGQLLHAEVSFPCGTPYRFITWEGEDE